METILLSEFKSLVAKGDWQREQHIEVVEKGPRLLEEGETAGGRNEVVSVTGWASKTSMLGELTVSYTEHFGYDVGQPDSFYHGLGRGNCEEWVVDGMMIIDDLGNPLTERDLMP